MSSQIENDAKQRMVKSIQGLEENLTKIRTGRAHPNLLDKIMVSYYGNETPLNQVATIQVEGALMLCVRPWEKNMVQPIEKAIRTSDLGLNPATTGEIIRVPLPPLSEERRRELIKKVKGEGEQSKVAVRNIRRDALQSLKDKEKKKEISEDDLRRAEERMQKLTDNHVDKIDEILAQKEKELLVI